MLKHTKKIAAILAILSLGQCSYASERLDEALLDIKPIIEVLEPVVVKTEDPEEPQKQYWTCSGCTDVENIVLKALQDQGIEDKVALAVLMGNIQQESKFETTICEGGQKTGYHHCHRGGFGLIQWTTVGRYNGLGQLAKQHQLDPNSLEAQLKWLFAEREWKLVEDRFKTPGQSMSYYMNAAYRWLGWGIHGARTHYSHGYANKLKLV